jgi:hypothetical protein
VDGQRTCPYAGQGKESMDVAEGGSSRATLSQCCVSQTAVDFAYRFRSVNDSYQQEVGERGR